ncbi:CVNH domain-containing protein [Apiospora marii]|uniref:CVNH domain-containing protein n=1 Tax=Apiospora marii TaxID=335849 RepID=A0ABR1S9V1_9PEZI
MHFSSFIALSLWAIMATVVYASIGSADAHNAGNTSPVTGTPTHLLPTTVFPVTTITTGTTFIISTITSGNVIAPPSATAPGKANALISDRCKRFRINEGKDDQHGNIWLDAYCHDDQGQLWHSVINLNHCLQNVGGILEPLADGDFAQTCWQPEIYGDPATDMYVSCYPGNGFGGVVTSFDFAGSVVLTINPDGNFECFGIEGCAWNAKGCDDKPNGVIG